MEIEHAVRTFSDTIVDLKKALDAEETEIAALRTAFRLLEAVVELRDCSKWPAKYVAVSKKWEQWSGLREFDVIGKTDYDLRPRKMADQLTLLSKEVVGAQRTLSYVDSGNASTKYKALRFMLTPFTIGKSEFVVAIGIPVMSTSDG